MPVDKSKQGKAHQYKKQNGHGLYPEVRNKENGGRCNGDQSHKDGIGQMHDGHQKSILESIFYRVVKLCQYRINVQEYCQINNT